MKARLDGDYRDSGETDNEDEEMHEEMHEENDQDEMDIDMENASTGLEGDLSNMNM